MESDDGNRRSYIRHPTDVPINLESGNKDGGESPKLKDISLGGLCCRSEKPWAPGTAVRVQVPDVRPVFACTGQVTWCQKLGDDYEVGIEFAGSENLFKMRLVEQVCYIEHYRQEVKDREGRSLSGEEAAAEWIRKYASEFPDPEEDAGDQK